MKLKSAYKPFLYAVILAVGIFVGGKLGFQNAEESNASRLSNPKSKLNRLIDLIERDYVDAVNTDSIVEVTVNGILEKLDPHSVYIPPTEMEEVAQQMRGDFVGIGISFYVIRDTVAVIKPLAGGPSEKVGILPGDRILFADHKKLFGRGLPNDSLYAALKGAKGSEVTLTIFRKDTNKRLKFKVTRDVVPINSVDIGLKVSQNTGYIKVNRFSETTFKEFSRELAKLNAQQISNLVIDLRDNAGGYLDKAVKMADEFLPKGAIIVQTKNKKGITDKTRASEKGSFLKGNVYILINENSASASEILAGAIQDNDRGWIVGRRSFGKGLVQREMPLGDGSAVRLTVARYYTPSGRSIQKPYNGDLNDYFDEFHKRFQTGELQEKDSSKVADSLKFKTLKGRTVYGGGGITPDIFVPFTKQHGAESVEVLMQTGLTGFFVFEYLDNHRNKFKGVTESNFQTFMKENKDFVNDFIAFMSGKPFGNGLEKYKNIIAPYVRAEFGRQLFSEEMYFKVLLEHDPMLKAVFEHQKNTSKRPVTTEIQ